MVEMADDTRPLQRHSNKLYFDISPSGARRPLFIEGWAGALRKAEAKGAGQRTDSLHRRVSPGAASPWSDRPRIRPRRRRVIGRKAEAGAGMLPIGRLRRATSEGGAGAVLPLTVRENRTTKLGAPRPSPPGSTRVRAPRRRLVSRVQVRQWMGWAQSELRTRRGHQQPFESGVVYEFEVRFGARPIHRANFRFTTPGCGLSGWISPHDLRRRLRHSLALGPRLVALRFALPNACSSRAGGERRFFRPRTTRKARTALVWAREGGEGTRTAWETGEIDAPHAPAPSGPQRRPSKLLPRRAK